MWLWEGRVITGPDEYKWVHGASRPQAAGKRRHYLGRRVDEYHQPQGRGLKLQANEERFNAFMDNSPAIAFLKDEAGRYVYVNRPLNSVSTFARAVVQQDDAELWPDAAAALREHDHRVLSSRTTVEIEDTLHAPDGSVEYWRGYKFPGVDAAGHSLIAAMVIDVTKQKRIAAALQEQQEKLQQANAQLELLASKDGLTGLNNHRAFQAKLAEVFNQSARYGTPLSLVMLDVDNFKAYDDQFGHPAGDEVLKKVAACLQHSTRNTDYVARYGGEEFVIILSCTEAQNAFPVCERIRRSIEQTVMEHRSVTASFGIASFAPGTTSPESVG
jgi:diguanylate cyclase (GGDEF)-like protein/PAS domain S-box-containing protein